MQINKHIDIKYIWLYSLFANKCHRLGWLR